MKVKIQQSYDLQSLELWGLESCLSRAGQRALLLQLIQELKSLCAAGKIGDLKIYLGFQTLERMLLKSNALVASGSDDGGPSSREYAAWAECLVDFRVELPDELVVTADKGLIDWESRYFPLLEELTNDIREKAQSGTGKPANERRWFNLRDWQKTPAEWAAINAILLTAGAMYRSKWEACSNAEKLALYHLALHKRINPSNTEMLEQLALEGLIIVHRGRIRIVNNSFAYFVRHAEDAETLKELVEIGEAGGLARLSIPNYFADPDCHRCDFVDVRKFALRYRRVSAGSARDSGHTDQQRQAYQGKSEQVGTIPAFLRAASPRPMRISADANSTLWKSAIFQLHS